MTVDNQYNMVDKQCVLSSGYNQAELALQKGIKSGNVEGWLQQR